MGLWAAGIRKTIIEFTFISKEFTPASVFVVWVRVISLSYFIAVLSATSAKGVGEGGQGAGGQEGARASPLSKVGAQVGLCPPLLGRANALSSLFAHILWLKTHIFSNFFWLASLANFIKSTFSKLC